LNEAQAAVSSGRLRGIRNPVAWHASVQLQIPDLALLVARQQKASRGAP